jgi:hypothetical protein
MSETHIQKTAHREAPWNKGRLVGQKRALKPKEVWNIRARLQIDARRRDLALFNLAIDSKLRGCEHSNFNISCCQNATVIGSFTG